MRHIRILIILMLCLIILTGCACKHQLSDATCLTPKTCTLCGETEGEPAGHIWVDATCDFPKTCSVCAATEGQPLAHSRAVRECNLNYTALTMERQTYCTVCQDVLSSENITLDALHDGTHFLFDSQSFWERYAAIDEQFSFTFLSDVADEVTEETTQDILTLACCDAFGYVLKVRFQFTDLTEGDEEYAIPHCTRIVVEPAVSGVFGNPDPDGLLSLAQTPEDIEYADAVREKTHTVALNELMFRNLMVAFMTIDPNLKADSIYNDDGVIPLVLCALDVRNGKVPDMLGNLEWVDGEKPGVILNDIYYYANEDGNLVIEVVP